MTERSHSDVGATEQLYLRDAYQATMEAEVTAVDRDRVALNRTVFYATGGGQPHDTGILEVGDTGWAVTDVRKEGPLVWHTVASVGDPHGDPVDAVMAPAVGTAVTGTIDWDRRHQLMRTHTMLHVMGGVVWNRWKVPATGGNMEPLAARMDFELGPLPEGFRDELTEAVNAELAADRPIEVSFLDRAAADVDPALLRTKANLIPASVTQVRWSTSWASTAKRTAARTWRPPPRWAASRSPRPNRRARATSGCA